MLQCCPQTSHEILMKCRVLDYISHSSQKKRLYKSGLHVKWSKTPEKIKEPNKYPLAVVRYVTWHCWKSSRISYPWTFKSAITSSLPGCSVWVKQSSPSCKTSIEILNRSLLHRKKVDSDLHTFYFIFFIFHFRWESGMELIHTTPTPMSNIKLYRFCIFHFMCVGFVLTNILASKLGLSLAVL